MIHIKRIYEPYDAKDGYRILVDRLWPRGISKATAHVDEWLKEVAPSTELRKWFHHTPENWTEFEKKYLVELKDNTALDILLQRVKEHKQITLLYAAKNEAQNQAIILKELLTKKKK